MRFRKRKKLWTRCIATMLVAVFLSTDALALVKEVYVGGAYSANDLAQSDNRVSMDEVKDDYSHFRQTDWLTEYFHRDQRDPVKPDVNEALAWLIDNEVISRDLQMTISNIKPWNTTSNAGVPTVSILKAEGGSILSSDVTRSDLIMYLYRAVYGPIDGRTLAVETPNIRVDNGSKNTLWRIMYNHDYFETIQNGHLDGIFQSVNGNNGGNGTAGSAGGNGYNSTGASGASGSGGGHGGNAHQTVTTSIREAGVWRYTPQGDEYESIFGDTNIFISQVDIDQKVETGKGGDGGNGGAGGSATATGDGASAVGGAGGNGGGGGGTGGANGAIQYETDYKQIYYTPGPDLIFYRTNDVLEEYLAAALSKGLLTGDGHYFSKKFDETFVKPYQTTTTSNDTNTPIWSGRAKPRVLNSSATVHNKVNTASDTVANIKDTLGVNFTVTFHSGDPASLTVSRNMPFSCNSGYFVNEDITKMDVYRHIYEFISAGEKSLSVLETNIINYKYGLDLAEYGSADDTYIIKYLIAKGIINFESKADVMNLTAPLNYREFLPILYRVANKDARYDFSKIQLTDSEAQWQSQSYGQRTLYLTDSKLPGAVHVELSDSLRLDPEVDPDAAAGIAAVSYVGGEAVAAEGAEPLDIVETVDNGLALGAGVTGTERIGHATAEATRIGDKSVNGMTFNFLGAAVYDASSAEEFVKDLLKQVGADKHYLQNLTLSEWGKGIDSALYDVTGAGAAMVGWMFNCNPPSYSGDSVEQCMANMLSEDDGTEATYGALESMLTSIFFINLVNRDPDAYDAVYDLLSDMDKETAQTEYIAPAFSIWNPFGGDIAIGDNILNCADNFVTMCHELASKIKRYTFWGKNEVTNVRFHISSTATDVNATAYSDLNSMPIEGGYTTLRYLAVNLVSIEFDMEVGGVIEHWTVDESAWERDASGLKAGPTGASNWRPNVNSDSVSEAANAGNDRLFVFTMSAGEDILRLNMNTSQTGVHTGNSALVNALNYQYSAAMSSTELTAAIKDQTSLKVECPTGGSENGFVNWSTLESSGLPIKKVSDQILQNTETNTFAYFPAPDSATKYALVGTTIVPGDQAAGACKYVNGFYWYWWDAIKLLVGAKGENAALNGLKGVTLPAQAVSRNTAAIPLVYESGYKSNSVYGLRIRLSSDKTNPALVEKLRVDPDAKTVWDASQSWEDNKGFTSNWANFLAVSTSNRALNLVSRKVIYEDNKATGVGGTQKSAFIVMLFNVDTEIAGSAGVTKDMSLEQVLDSIAQPPSDAESLEKYKKNYDMANAVANWIYQTTGVEYVSTGYLKPQIYLFSDTDNMMEILTQSGFNNISEDLKEVVLANLDHSVLDYVALGCVDRPGISKPQCVPTSDDPDTIDRRMTPDFATNYYLSHDYKFAVVGDRLYVNTWMFPNLEPGEDTETFGQTGLIKDKKFYLQVRNAAVQSTAFTLGRVFCAEGYTDDYIRSGGPLSRGFPTPKMTVVETKSDGTVVCQVGPIAGMPVTVGTSMCVIYSGMTMFDRTKKLSEVKDSTSDNVYKFVTDVMFKNYGGGITFEPNGNASVVSKPLLTIPTGSVAKRSYINTGSSIEYYSGKSMYGDDSVTVSLISAQANDTLKSIGERYEKSMSTVLKNSRGGSDDGTTAPSVWETETYINVSFSAYEYTVKENQLVKSSMTAGDLLSPALFTNLNDLIIDKMIDESLGAIPVNEIPSGAMLELGSGFYVAATNDSDTKVFAGLSSLDTSFAYINAPTLQEATYSFGGHFLRGGQQYINVTHYFDEFTVLSNTANVEEWQRLTAWKTALQSTVDYGMSDLGATKMNRYCITADGVTYQLVPTKWGTAVSTKDMSGGAQFYAPVLIRLNSSLYAYEVAETDGVKRFRLCDHAPNSVTGALSNLPFFTDDVLESKLSDLTGRFRTGGYTFYHGAKDLMEQMQRNFQAAFAGDLFTLIRMLVFIVLLWLFLMSWVCYAFYASRLMPMVDALCHPTSNSNRKGIDLFKIFSLGTISVDSDFKLGRFLQYDFIIAILIVIVWKSGTKLF